MEVEGLVLTDSAEQVRVQEVADDMPVQFPPVWIDESRERADDCGQRQGIDGQDDGREEEARMQVRPRYRNSGDYQQIPSASLQIQNEPEQQHPTEYMRPCEPVDVPS